MRRLLVAGATGYLGGFVVREARRRGYWVRALARPGRSVPEAHEVVTAEATHPDSLDGVCADIDVVFSSLGITRQTDRAGYADVDYGANLTLLRRAEAAGVGRFGFVSVLHPERFAGNALMDARERFIAALRASSVPGTVVRATGFFNDMEEFLDMARGGTVWVLDRGARMNPIHGADLAVVVLDALEAGTPTCTAGGPEPLTQPEIGALAFSALGRPARVRALPPWLVTLVLAALRVTRPRLHTIVQFMRIGGTSDMLGTPHGDRRLGRHFHDRAEAGP